MYPVIALVWSALISIHQSNAYSIQNSLMICSVQEYDKSTPVYHNAASNAPQASKMHVNISSTQARCTHPTLFLLPIKLVKPMIAKTKLEAAAMITPASTAVAAFLRPVVMRIVATTIRRLDDAKQAIQERKRRLSRARTAGGSANAGKVE